MATPKKKHLIELMIEAGVKWPVGAEYAAQDKFNLCVNFFGSEGAPVYHRGNDSWSDDEDGWLGIGCGVYLPCICLNWHQTIVTRDQYAEAIAAAGNCAHEQQLHSEVAGVMPSETIESMLAEIKAKREEHDALVASAEALAMQIVGIELQVNDKLKEYGFAMSPVETPAKPAEQELVITDWRDLRIGDVVEYVHGTVCGCEGKQGSVCEIDKADNHNRIRVMFNEYERFWCSKWRFIRRP